MLAAVVLFIFNRLSILSDLVILIDRLMILSEASACTCRACYFWERLCQKRSLKNTVYICSAQFPLSDFFLTSNVDGTCREIHVQHNTLYTTPTNNEFLVWSGRELKTNLIGSNRPVWSACWSCILLHLSTHFSLLVIVISDCQEKRFIIKTKEAKSARTT